MPKPPPRFSSGTGPPCSSRRCTVQQPPGRLREPADAEDLRADVAVQAEQAQLGARADRGDDRGHLRQGDAELLVLPRGREVLVGAGVDAAVHPEAHALHDRRRDGRRRRRGRPPPRSRARSSRCRPRPRSRARRRTCRSRAGPIRSAGHARRECEGQLAAGGDVDAQPRVAHPAGDVGREERLRRVVDVHRGAERRDRLRERGDDAAGAGRAPPPRRARRAGCRGARRAR